MKNQPSPPPGEIEKRFKYQSPSPEGAARHDVLSDAFISLAHLIDGMCVDGREKSIAIIKLEEAKFAASASVARNEETR